MRRHRWQPRPAQSSKQSRAMSCHSVLQSTVRLPEPQSLQYQGRLSLSVSLWWGNITWEDITHLGSHSPQSSRDGREKLITLITAALGASVWQPRNTNLSTEILAWIRSDRNSCSVGCYFYFCFLTPCLDLHNISSCQAALFIIKSSQPVRVIQVIERTRGRLQTWADEGPILQREVKANCYFPI